MIYRWASRELWLKVAYQGAPLSGRLTSLTHVVEHLDVSATSPRRRLVVEPSRGYSVDFEAPSLGMVGPLKPRLFLQGLPGVRLDDAGHRAVLKGADGVVFVASSQTSRREANIEAREAMRARLSSMDVDPDELPTVYQYNFRDAPGAMPTWLLDVDLGRREAPFFESVATSGQGVTEALLSCVTMIIERAKKKR